MILPGRKSISRPTWLTDSQQSQRVCCKPRGTCVRREPETPQRTSSVQLNQTGLLCLLRHAVNRIKSPPPTNHVRRQTASYLGSCTHVMIRAGVAWRPLQQPYDGPHKVVERGPQHFTLHGGGAPKKVSIYHLFDLPS